MSDHEYQTIRVSMKPFYTLAIVLASSMLLASCGGGSDQAHDQVMTASESGSGESGTGEEARMKALAVPPGWTGRVPPRINNTPTTQAISSPQGKIAKNLLLLEIKIGQDSAALAYISSKRWSVVGRNDEIIKVTVAGDTYESLLTHKSAAEASGLFSLVEFIGFVNAKAFTNPNPSFSVQLTISLSCLFFFFFVFVFFLLVRPPPPPPPDPSLNDESFWNYDAINVRHSWSALGGLAALAPAAVLVMDHGFSDLQVDDLTLSSVYNSVGSTCSTTPSSGTLPCNHGYHVSGIIGATGNDGIGHVGIASGYTNKATVRGAVVSADDGLMVSLRDEVLTYNQGLKSSVINISLGNEIASDAGALDEAKFSELVEGARRSSRIIRSTIERRMAARQTLGLSNEVLFVQASGNEGKVKIPGGSYLSAENSYLFASFISYQTGSPWHTFVRDRTLLVGAFDSTRAVASFTSLPSTQILQERFILAPGVAIRSNTRLGIAAESGTSMAAPHVAAVAASISQVSGDIFSAKEISDIILSTADNQAGTEWKPGDGYKYLNAERAVKRAIELKNQVPATKDANIANPAGTWTGSEYLTVCGASWGITAKALLQFDVSGVPQSINNAYLNLYAVTGDNSYQSTVDVYRNLAPWEEATVNWTNRPAIESPRSSSIAVPVGQYATWYRVPITDLVRSWKTTPANNYGVTLDSAVVGNSGCRSFASMEASNTTIRPHISWD